MKQTAPAAAGVVASPPAPDATLQARMDGLMRTDTIWAVGFVIALWVSYLYVFIGVLPHVTEPGITVALVVFGLLVGLFNTMSITALIRHYREDQTYIYALDIRHSDANRAAKVAARGV